LEISRLAVYIFFERKFCMRNLYKVLGTIALVAVIGFSIVACGGDDGGTDPGPDAPENWPVAKRWWRWVEPTATATLNYSVDPDGVCTITVGGQAQPDKWKAIAGYSYTGEAGTSYDYTFEAWTKTGERTLGVLYYQDNDAQTYLGKDVHITETRTTYTVNGQSLPKSGEKSLEFQCADQLGTFYVKIVSITTRDNGDTIQSDFYGTWDYYYNGEWNKGIHIYENDIGIDPQNAWYKITEWERLDNERTNGFGNNTDYPSGYRISGNWSSGGGSPGSSLIYTVFLHKDKKSIVINTSGGNSPSTNAVYTKAYQ
jgi:hypothetical protein